MSDGAGAVTRLGTGALPYKLACLCDLRDADGRVLLLHRSRAPNQGLYSPIGGKLHMDEGESPAVCAQREILEEAEIEVPLDRLHLLGLVSECAYEGRQHWLLFYYRVLGPVEVEAKEMREGRLDWHEESAISGLNLPLSDRGIIWPMVQAHETPLVEGGKPGSFIAHIDCVEGGMVWSLHQSDRLAPFAGRFVSEDQH